MIVAARHSPKDAKKEKVQETSQVIPTKTSQNQPKLIKTNQDKPRPTKARCVCL